MRGVAVYVDPANNAIVELPNGYDSVWSNGAGEYLLATGPSYDPNAELSTNHDWMRMKAAA